MFDNVVAGLGKDVPAALVVVQPRRAALTRRGVVRIVYPDEPPQRVIGVGHQHISIMKRLKAQKGIAG